MTAKAASVIGQKFGSLTVLTEREEVGKSRGGKYYRYAVWVECDCGNRKQVVYEYMRCGKLTGCGCKRGSFKSMNGLSRTKEYRAWAGMLDRCYDPTYELYHRYGGRGIVVCDRWKSSLENFIADMGLCPPEMNSIDRENNDGNYEPGNCRWATAEMQSNNKSNNLLYELNGERKTLRQWCRLCDVDYKTVWSRIRYSKWDFVKAINTPVTNDGRFKKGHKKYSHI